jgi:hypothetical protein
MSDFQDTSFSNAPASEAVPTTPGHVEDGTTEALAPVEADVHGDGHSLHPSWHAEAGRKGAYRIRELIRLGKLYEQEHGLKSGRQRLRQLIEEGKLYEQEHGLQSSKPHGRRSRGPRMRPQELVGNLLESLARLARPGLRVELLRLLHELEAPRAGE